MNSVFSLVILAAGRASRYGSLKQQAAIGPSGETMIDYAIYDGIQAGFRKIVLVVSETASADFSSRFNELPSNIDLRIAVQASPTTSRSRPWGTAHALLCSQSQIEEPFAVINADDFYGRRAFSAAARFLRSQRLRPGTLGMLGYELRDTLSDHGTVSRAICGTNAQGQLESINEHLQIQVVDDSIVSIQLCGDKTLLAGTELISMNFWLLSPAIFAPLEREFTRFLQENSNSESAEFALPAFIGDLVRQGTFVVDVLAHAGRWFGLTHREDYDTACAEVKELHKSSHYPSPLWVSQSRA